MSTDRRGFGILFLIVNIVIVTLGAAFFAVVFRVSVTGENQSYSDGRVALNVARSCLSEAVLSFRSQVNTPETGWYKAVRESDTTAQGMESWLQDNEYSAAATKAEVASDPDLNVGPVRVSVWRDFAFDPDHGPYDEKFGLLTVTADVGVREPGMSPFRGYVRRQVQRSYYLKQCRVSAPKPFGGYTLYVHYMPNLRNEKNAYDKLIKDYSQLRKTLQAHYDAEIDAIVAAIKNYLAWARRKVADIDDSRRKLEEMKSKIPIMEAAAIATLGTITPQVIAYKQGVEKFEQGLKDDIRATHESFGLPDEATFRQVAANPYPPDNLETDIAFKLESGTWPPFRDYKADADAGLSDPGQPLENPVVVERTTKRVQSREADYRKIDPLVLPDRPVYSLKASDIKWLDRYGTHREVFKKYDREYGERLDAFIAAHASEFERHERLFKVLPQKLAEYDDNVINLTYQSRRSTLFFKDEDAFVETVSEKGAACFNGVYAVKGDLKKLPREFRGRGLVVVEHDVELDSITKIDARSTLVIIAGGSISIKGRCQAGLFAATGAGRLKSTDTNNLVDHAVLGQLTLEDNFTVERQDDVTTDGPDGLWVNVSPARIAESLLRQ